MSDPAEGGSTYPAALREPAAWLDPFDWYAEMREAEPVRYDTGRGAWDVFRYEDVTTVLGDPGTFSSDPQEAAWYDADGGGSPLLDALISVDPPRHGDLRGAVADRFTEDAAADLAPRVREFAADLLDDVVGAGERDFVAAVAEPLPVAVVAELLGIPEADRERFARWTRTVVEMHVGTGDPGADADAEASHAETMQGLTAYFRDRLVERRAEPRDDLLTAVATASAGGGGLDAREMLGFCLLMLVGGTVTARNLLGNALWSLAERPGLLADYLAGDRPVAGLVEETLRYRSPVQGLSRYATAPTTLRGHQVDAGDVVVAWPGSANRDPARFDDPAAFRPGRSPNPHLGFGHGTHYCLGAPLARLEAELLLGDLFERAGSIEVDTDDLAPFRSRGKLMYGVESLPVRVEPA